MKMLQKNELTQTANALINRSVSRLGDDKNVTRQGQCEAIIQSHDTFLPFHLAV